MANFASLQDSFNAPTFNSTLWTKSDSADTTQVNQRNGQMEVAHTAAVQYNALSSIGTYDLTSSAAFVRVVDAGNQALTSHEVILFIALDASNKTWISINSGSVAAWKKIAGTNTFIASGPSFLTGKGMWLRIRESAGTIYYDTSTDSRIWTNFASLINPFVVTALVASVQSGCYNAEASPSYAYFDNFNLGIGISKLGYGIRPKMFTPGRAL